MHLCKLLQEVVAMNEMAAGGSPQNTLIQCQEITQHYKGQGH